MKWLLILALLSVPSAAWAQSETLGTGEGTAEVPVAGLPDAPEQPAAEPAQDETAKAQADVDQARKLARVRRFDEASKLLEDAYLVLEDVEILRILGETWEAAADTQKALHYYRLYVADEAVGEMARKPVQERINALDEEAGASNMDEAGLTGWTSQGAGGGTAGGWFLTLGGRFGYNEGGDFHATREVDGEVVDVDGSWNHAGLGVALEVGTYLLDDLGLGLRLGVDWMTWENQARRPAFAVAPTSGLRPDAALNLRWYPGLGFHAGLTAGADLVVVTDGGMDECEGSADCPEVGEGLQAARLFYGPLLGYRTALAEDLSIGLDLSFRHLPVYLDAGGTTSDLDGFADPSWMVTLALSLNLNL